VEVTLEADYVIASSIRAIEMHDRPLGVAMDATCHADPTWSVVEDIRATSGLPRTAWTRPLASRPPEIHLAGTR
jgi:hypothetical protein